jgi:hypothetical protein
MHFNNTKLFLFFQLMICLFLDNIAAIDHDSIQSAKCTKYFKFFEKKYNIPEHGLFAISILESGKIHKSKKRKIPWPWTVNVAGDGYYFKTKKEAVKFVKDQLSIGKENIDIGCMQINLKHHPKAFKNIEHAFEPKANINYAGQLLFSNYKKLGNWSDAISRYHSGTQELGAKYLERIFNIAKNIDLYKTQITRNRFDRLEDPL